MSDDQYKTETSAPFEGAGSREFEPARQEDSFAQLSADCGEYLDSYLVLAQLHGQRWLLSLCKMFLLSIATLILLLAAWGSLVQALLDTAIQLGVVPALAMLFAAVSNLALAWWCWGRLCRRLQRLVLRPATVDCDGGTAGGSNAD